MLMKNERITKIQSSASDSVEHDINRLMTSYASKVLRDLKSVLCVKSTNEVS